LGVLLGSAIGPERERHHDLLDQSGEAREVGRSLSIKEQPCL
jgi:hypothetical protein